MWRHDAALLTLHVGEIDPRQDVGVVRGLGLAALPALEELAEGVQHQHCRQGFGQSAGSGAVGILQGREGQAFGGRLAGTDGQQVGPAALIVREAVGEAVQPSQVRAAPQQYYQGAALLVLAQAYLSPPGIGKLKGGGDLAGPYGFHGMLLGPEAES